MREDEEKEALPLCLSVGICIQNKQRVGPTDHRGRLYLTDGESLKMRKRRQTDRQTDREDQTSSFSLRVPNLPSQVVFPLSTFYVILVDDVG